MERVVFQQLPSSDGDWLRTADACLRALRLHETEAPEITDWWRSDGTWRLYARFEWCLVRTELLDARLCGSLALGVSESNALLGEVDRLDHAWLLACGQPEMQDAARHHAVERGLRPERFLTNY